MDGLRDRSMDSCDKESLEKKNLSCRSWYHWAFMKKFPLENVYSEMLGKRKYWGGGSWTGSRCLRQSTLSFSLANWGK